MVPLFIFGFSAFLSQKLPRKIFLTEQKASPPLGDLHQSSNWKPFWASWLENLEDSRTWVLMRIVESEWVQILWAVKLSKVHHMHQMQSTTFHRMNHIRSIECKSCCIRILLTQFGESAISFRVRAFPAIVSFVHWGRSYVEVYV